MMRGQAIRRLACLSLALATAARAQEAQGTQAPAAQPPLAPATPPARVLTLEQALEAARANQPLLRQARANTSAAGARADEARAPLLPQLSASGQYQRVTGNQVPRPGVPTSASAAHDLSWSSAVNLWTFGVTLNQIIFDFGQTSGRWRAAQAAASSQRDSERATALQTALSVRVAFFNARATRDLVGVARDNLTNVETHLRQTEAFVRAGTHPEIDLAQARTNQANAQVQLINSENVHLAARAVLNQAMGDEGDTNYEVSDDGLEPLQGEDLPLDDLMGEAVAARPDLAALQEQVRAQQLLRGAVRGAYLPALGVSAGASAVGTTPSGSVPNWNVGVTLTWNLFEGGLTRAQEQEASANIDAARAQADVLRQQVRVDVEQARLAVRAAKSTLSATISALENAREQLRLASRRYETGVGNAVELSDAELAVANAAAQRVQADFNLATSRAQLLRALGRELPHA